MGPLETQIMQRYFRKTMAHTEGAVLHKGDCDVFTIKICTCGLHDDLQKAKADFVEEHYPKLNEELAEYEVARYRLMGHRSRKKN